MRNTFWILIVFLLWGISGSHAQAWYWDCGYCCPPPPCCVAYETRVVTCYRTEWKEEKIPIVVERVSYKPETIKVKVTEYVPATFDQMVRTSYYVAIPKVIERDVATCVMVPFAAFDPCTCCCYVSYCPQWVTRKVQYSVCDYQLQARDDVVKVCKMVPQERVVDQTRMIPVVTKENTWSVRYTCVAVPYQTTVSVPVVIPCCP